MFLCSSCLFFIIFSSFCFFILLWILVHANYIEFVFTRLVSDINPRFVLWTEEQWTKTMKRQPGNGPEDLNKVFTSMYVWVYLYKFPFSLLAFLVWFWQGLNSTSPEHNATQYMCLFYYFLFCKLWYGKSLKRDLFISIHENSTRWVMNEPNLLSL